jgi:hypothetical protein
MTLSPSQAAESLKQIEKTARTSASAYGYAHSSPYFVLWGMIWMVGYAGSDLIPEVTGHYRGVNYLWMALTVLGIVACFAIGRRQHLGGDQSAGRRTGIRIFASFAVIYFFIGATFMVMRPANPLVSAAFVPLVVAMFYALTGVWKGLRFLVAGMVLAALTLGGFFFLREHFLLWMAAVGGGSLVLVGFWLRSI